uniref:ATP synthase subunit a n=1 Tax=Harmostica fulvicornis TaxID=2813413 RepID=A0A8T9VZ92_9HEMI|nr:ATPase subunit 6 [Harmostica fulvicornis]UPI55329.1 ATPase subunit 6 [Harmostica fulvicornis]
MMTNLFSTFDPATSVNMSMNWSSSIYTIILLPITFWKIPNRSLKLMNIIITKLHQEFKTLMGNKSKGLTIMMISLFIMIMINNSMGLLPYMFTSTSHMTMNLTLALPLWMTMMLFGWINQTNMMFAHLIPNNTPTALMPFMVLIETTSNIIRPGSLAVRLTANMIAGHLLMSLLGNNLTMKMFPMLIILQMSLMMFEMAVAIIQAYVFSVLSTLYSSEVI